MQRIQPHSPDLEEHVLGACFFNATVSDKVTGFVGKHFDFFEIKSHRFIYEAMYRLSESKKSIDTVLVCDALAERGRLESVGGAGRVAKLANVVLDEKRVDEYLNKLNDYFTTRQVISGATRIINLAHDDEVDADELIKEFSVILDSVAKKKYQNRSTPVQDILQDTLEGIEDRMKNPGIHGVPTGFAIDKYTGGWQDGSLYIIGARPSIGKTALVLQSAYHAASIPSNDKQRPGYYWNGEMLNKDMVARLVAIESGVNFVKMRDGRLSSDDFSRIVKAAERVHEARLNFDDTPGIGIHELRSKYKAFVSDNNGQGVLYADYLQLMSGHKEGNREQEISSIARGLKEIALETQTPVIALSQLSRECLKRNYCSPNLGDLRESGTLEQDADGVILLNRPEFFKYEEYNNKPAKGLGIADVAKMRQGMTGEIEMRFNKTFAEWQNPLPTTENNNNNHSSDPTERPKATMPHGISLDDDDQPF